MMTIPLIHQYQFRDGRFVLRERSTIFSVTTVFLTLCFLLSISGSAWAPVTPALAYAPSSDTTERPEVETLEPKETIAAPISLPPDPHPGIVAYIRASNKDIPEDDALEFATHIVSSAAEFKLDLATFAALLKVESRFHPEATSGAGARGLAQVIPKWHTSRIEEARKLFNSYSIYEPRLNIYVGASALRAFITSSRDLPEALLLYNGSSTDSRKSYAKLVLDEAKVVQKNFLTPRSR